MAEHLTTEQLDAYGQQRLSFAELIATDAHLVACAACRQRLEAALPGSTIALYADLQVEAASPAHLSFEQMAGYVDDSLDHAAALIVRDHLASCMQCAHATEDLRKFAATDKASPRPVVESQTSWWERMREWVRVPAFGWALAALLLVVVAGWLLWRRSVDAPQYANRDATPTPLPVLSPTPLAPETAPLLAQLPLLQLNDGGGQVTLDQQGKLSGLEALSPAHQHMVKDALTTQRLERSSALADLQRRGSSLMGADDQGHRFALQAPAGKVVLSDRPLFNWSRLAGATSYVVEIYDEQFTLVAQSEPLTQSQFTPPRRLARGRAYAWQVKAVKDGQTVTAPAPPAPQARFRIVAATQAEGIARARRDYAGAHHPSHLPLALLYVQAGLLDEAEAELRALRQANPQSEAVRRWLSQVQAMRR